MDSSPQSPLSVALLDAHCIVRDGLECLIERSEGLSVVGSVATGGELGDCLELAQVDVVVMGLILEGEDGLRCIADWSAAYPATKFLVLSQLPEGIYAERVLQAGGAGYLMKDVKAEVLLTGIRRVAAGEVVVSEAITGYLLSNFPKKNQKQEGDIWSRLTDRELLVLNLTGHGHATAAIATSMGISRKTVSTFKERIKVKLSLENSLQLSQIALQSLGREAEGRRPKSGDRGAGARGQKTEIRGQKLEIRNFPFIFPNVRLVVKSPTLFMKLSAKTLRRKDGRSPSMHTENH